MSSFSRWLAATSGVLAVAAVTWGRRWLPPRADVEVTVPPGERPPALADIRDRLLAPRDWVEFGGRALFRRAWFAGASSFAGAWFRGREDFVDAAFGGESSFENTRFGHRIHVD